MTFPVWLDHLILTWGYWAVLVAVMIESTGIPFPGETGLLAAAVFAGTGRPLDIWLVIVAASGGAILGDNFGYLVGHYGGYPLVYRILKLLHVKPSALTAAQEYFAKHGDKTVFVGRFFALLRVTVAFLAGVNRMPWRKFLLWNALGGIAWAALYGALGFFLGRHLSLLGTVVRAIGVGGTVIVVAAIAAVVTWWFVRRRQAERAATQPVGAAATPARLPAGPAARRLAAARRPVAE